MLLLKLSREYRAPLNIKCQNNGANTTTLFLSRVSAKMLALVSVLGAWLKEPSPGPDAASAAAISQRHDQPKAYALAYTRQVMWRPAANQLPAPVAIDRIFWLHVPKCGSSFTHTIFHYACARPVSWSCGNSVHHPPPDYCGTNRSTIQEQMHGGNYHTPIRWVQGMGGRFEPRANVGNVVAVFRSPAQRLLSAFSWMKQMPLCCGGDWGMGPANGSKRASVLKMPDAATLARLPYSQGCMTKMIIGFRCFDDHTLTDKEMERARRFVDEGMAFVGLQGEWSRTVCLWHARFGGPLFQVELSNTRPTNRTTYQHTMHNESELETLVDHADTLLYAAAEARFRRELRTHAVAIAACEEALLQHPTAQEAARAAAMSKAREEAVVAAAAAAAPVAAAAGLGGAAEATWHLKNGKYLRSIFPYKAGSSEWLRLQVLALNGSWIRQPHWPPWTCMVKSVVRYTPEFAAAAGELIRILIVRSPYERMLSAYMDKVVTHGQLQLAPRGMQRNGSFAEFVRLAMAERTPRSKTGARHYGPLTRWWREPSCATSNDCWLGFPNTTRILKLDRIDTWYADTIRTLG